MKLGRSSRHVGLLAFVSLAALAGQIGFARLILEQPIPVAKDVLPSKGTFVPLSKETLAPARAEITIERSTVRTVLSQEIAGTVTTVPRLSIPCSQQAIAVDGVERPLMCGPTPLWRTIDWGVSGADVTALRGLLNDRGYDVITDRLAYDAGLEAAILSYRKEVGLPAGSSFDVSFVLYSPGPIELSEVAVAVADRINAGSTLGRTGGGIVRASMAAETYPVSERIVSVGQTTYNLRSESSDTWLLVGDLSKLGTSTSNTPTSTPGAQAGPRQTVQGTATFAKPRTTWSVPLTSVRSTGDQQCVFTLSSTGQPSARHIEIIDAADASVDVTGISADDTILTFESDAGQPC